MTDETTQPETNLPEQNVEVGKKKSNKAIIIINIIAVLLIGGMAAYYFFVFKKEPEFGPGGRGFAAGELSSEDFCERWEERQENSGDFQPPEGRELPEGFEDRMEEQDEMMERICEDGEVSDDEQKELDEMRSNFREFRN